MGGRTLLYLPPRPSGWNKGPQAAGPWGRLGVLHDVAGEKERHR